MSDPPLDKEKFSDPPLDKIRSALTDHFLKNIFVYILISRKKFFFKMIFFNRYI